MHKIGFIRFKSSSKFWLYVINPKQWENLNNHFSRDDKIYIPTFKYERIMPYDVIIIYVKILGFMCTAVSEQKAIPCEQLKVRIFDDISIGKFNIEIRDIHFFIKPISVSDIFHYISKSSPKCKTKLSFMRKFCAGEFIYNGLDNELGKKLLEGVETVSRINNNIWLKQKHETILDKDKRKKKFNKSYYKAKRKINTNQFSSVLQEEFEIYSDNSDNSNNYDNSANSENSENSENSDPSECISIEDNTKKKLTPMIPILFDPCDEFRWHDECINDDDFIEEFKSHYQRCNECEINNNNNQSLGPFINCSEITFDIACIIGDDGFIEILNAYSLASEKILDEDSKNNFIRLYVIQDPDYHYDNTILIEWAVKASTFTKVEIID